MATLEGGSGRRSSSLGSGTSRSRGVVAGSPGRTAGVSGRTQSGVGQSIASCSVIGVSETLFSPGNRIQLENTEFLLQETSDFLLLEDGRSFGSSEGTSIAIGVGASIADAFASANGTTSIVCFIEVVGSGVDNLLKEDGNDILQEDGTSFLLLETGEAVPPTAILDTQSFPFRDTSGGYILGL